MNRKCIKSLVCCVLISVSGIAFSYETTDTPVKAPANKRGQLSEGFTLIPSTDQSEKKDQKPNYFDKYDDPVVDNSVKANPFDQFDDMTDAPVAGNEKTEAPSRFTLDRPKPNSNGNYGAELPVGFTLDEPKEKKEAQTNERNILASAVAIIILSVVIYLWRLFIKPLIKNIFIKTKQLDILKVVKTITVGSLFIVILFPPWIESFKNVSRPLGYAFLFISPHSNHNGAGVSIDYGRLLLQIFLIGGVYLLADKLSKGKK